MEGEDFRAAVRHPVTGTIDQTRMDAVWQGVRGGDYSIHTNDTRYFKDLGPLYKFNSESYSLKLIQKIG